MGANHVGLGVVIGLLLGLAWRWASPVPQQLEQGAAVSFPTARPAIDDGERDEQRGSEVSYHDSLGFMRESNERWAIRKKHCRLQQAKQIYNANSYNAYVPRLGQGAVYLFANWEPNFSCASERRIGRQADGGKWVCDPDRIAADSCLVYSIGSNGDFSFEEAILREISPNCRIFTFDPTMGGTPKVVKGVKFLPWGLASKDGPFDITMPRKTLKGLKGMRLSSIVRELGHTGKVIDIFKIDCEGCEFDVYREFENNGFILRQILVEVHSTVVNSVLADFFRFLSQAGYVIFHKEPNILTGGKAVEFAFLKMDKGFCPSSLLRS